MKLYCVYCYRPMPKKIGLKSEIILYFEVLPFLIGSQLLFSKIIMRAWIGSRLYNVYHLIKYHKPLTDDRSWEPMITLFNALKLHVKNAGQFSIAHFLGLGHFTEKRLIENFWPKNHWSKWSFDRKSFDQKVHMTEIFFTENLMV
jgi:hypothetical protein